MPLIKPERLKHWREKRSLSMAELAERSNIDKSTIFRIESSTTERKTRANVVRELAAALAIKEEDLMSDGPLPTEKAEPMTEPTQEMSFQLTHQIANAYAFAQMRFGVTPQTLAELAPLLFVMVAEDCQEKRREAFHALAAFNRTEETLLGEHRTSVRALLTMEGQSVDANDVFGRQFDHPNGYPYFFERGQTPVGKWNPFTHHVNAWFQAREEDEGIKSWGEAGPRYKICRTEALKFVGGDEELADALLDGHAAIRELPRELLKKTDDALEKRQEFIRKAVAENPWVDFKVVFEESSD